MIIFCLLGFHKWRSVFVERLNVQNLNLVVLRCRRCHCEKSELRLAPEPRPGWLSERMQSPAFREAFTRPDEPEPAPGDDASKEKP